MLDDLKAIHDRDSDDALGAAERQIQQLLQEFKLAKTTLPKDQAIQNIVFAGLGEAQLAAELSRSWPGYNLPFEVCRSFELPKYVNHNTLFVAVDPLGSTPEILEMLVAAESRKATIVVIAASGKLLDTAATKDYPLLTLLGGVKPISTTLLVYKALLTIFISLGLCEGLNLEQLNLSLMPDLTVWLKAVTQAWSPIVATKNNYAKRLALECVGKSVVIYSGPYLAAVAQTWKASFNKYARNIAWSSQMPDVNNEMLGWTAQPVNKPYAVIDLRSKLDNEEVSKSFIDMERSLSGQRPASQVVQAEGDTILQQMFWVVLLGNFVSLYTALLNGLNPTSVDVKE